MKKLKILYIFSTNIISGAENVTIDFIKTDKDNEYFVFSADIPELIVLLKECVKEENIFGSKWLRLQNVISSKGLNKIFNLCKKLISILIVRYKMKYLENTIKPDLIIGHNTHDSIFFYRSSTKKILQLYDYLIKGSHLYFMIKRSDKYIKKYIVDSIGLKNNVASNGVNPDKIEVISYCKNVRIEKPRNVKRTPVILWVGSFEDRKDPVEFFNILNLLIENKFKFNVNFVYRKTELSYFNQHFKLIDLFKNKIEFNVYENLNRVELDKVYDNSDILILTSKEDSFPTVILEAFSFGLPVISRDIDGVYDMLFPEKNGYIYKNISEVPDLVKKIISNYTNFSFEALNLVKNKYSPEEKLRKMKKVYENILSEV